jgi:hypothetical protein
MSDAAENLRFEIGHLLFIDIVGYSKLLIEAQKERLNQLTRSCWPRRRSARPRSRPGNLRAVWTKLFHVCTESLPICKLCAKEEGDSHSVRGGRLRRISC